MHSHFYCYQFFQKDRKYVIQQAIEIWLFFLHQVRMYTISFKLHCSCEDNLDNLIASEQPVPVCSVMMIKCWNSEENLNKTSAMLLYPTKSVLLLASSHQLTCSVEHWILLRLVLTSSPVVLYFYLYTSFI